MMQFIYPVLKEMRILTKLFQCNTADNFKIYGDLKSFFLKLGRRVLRKSTLDKNNVEQLCQIVLSDKHRNIIESICWLPLNETDFGELFLTGIFISGIHQPLVDRYPLKLSWFFLWIISIFSGIRQFSQNTQKLLKERARNFLRKLFVGIQTRMLDTFKMIRIIEPFSLPTFKNSAPKKADYKQPFFKTGSP